MIKIVLYNVMGGGEVRKYIHNQDDERVILTKFDDYYNVMYYSRKEPRYEDYWVNRDVYKDTFE
jgi:hypothetical protein